MARALFCSARETEKKEVPEKKHKPRSRGRDLLTKGGYPNYGGRSPLRLGKKEQGPDLLAGSGRGKKRDNRQVDWGILQRGRKKKKR